jgi:hypothetical protein
MSSTGVLFRGFAILAAIAAFGARAAAPDWPGRPGTSPETAAAVAKADAGDPSSSRTKAVGTPSTSQAEC